MSTDAKSALNHDMKDSWALCPLPPVQLASSVFLCRCGRRWTSDGEAWCLRLGDGEPVRRVPQPEEPKGRIVAGSVDQMRLHTANGWAQWLVREPTGREWTLTLAGLRIEEGNHLAPWSQT